MLTKSEKLAKQESTKYHQRVCKKVESFLRTFENPIQALNHDKKENLTMNVMLTF